MQRETAVVPLRRRQAVDSVARREAGLPAAAAQRVNHTCRQLVNDFGETAQCDGKLQLPSIGQYLLVVQNKPTVGSERVAAALLVGRSAASWQAQPLRALTGGRWETREHAVAVHVLREEHALAVHVLREEHACIGRTAVGMYR